MRAMGTMTAKMKNGFVTRTRKRDMAQPQGKSTSRRTPFQITAVSWRLHSKSPARALLHPRGDMVGTQGSCCKVDGRKDDFRGYCTSTIFSLVTCLTQRAILFSSGITIRYGPAFASNGFPSCRKASTICLSVKSGSISGRAMTTR